MRAIFEQGSLSAYSQVRLDDSRSPILEHSQYGARKTTVFISHKYDDLDDLKGLLGFLEKRYSVKVYIDSRDPSMSKITSAQTALNIRERIKGCDKFILLATNGAIESKWCNWELGYGDAQNFKKHIALFQMKPENTSDIAYKGSEYMSVYLTLPITMERRPIRMEAQSLVVIMLEVKNLTERIILRLFPIGFRTDRR